MLTALYGGSFDPMHLGHLGVVEKATELFESVRIVVLANAGKHNGMFDRSIRADLIRRAIARLPMVSVHEFDGLIVDAAIELDADVLLRSAHKEVRHERSMAATNETLSGIPTSFVLPEPRTAWISSTMVRDLYNAGRLDDVRHMVPAPVFEALQARATRSDLESS